MKNIFKIGTLFIATLIAVHSCKPDLNLVNPQELSTDTYYKTADQLEGAIIPAYEALIGRVQGGYARSFYYELLAPGDDFNHTFKWEPMYYDTYNTPSSDGLLSGTWKDMWNGVFASNLAISKISEFTGPIDPARKSRMLGEAYFLRGVFYLHLGMMFGETIPLIDKPVTSDADYYSSNSQKGQIYALITRDLAKAADLLPLRSALYANAAFKGRATKGSAQAYLAKAYLYRPILELGQPANFAGAEAELKKVIDSKEYQLVSAYKDNFSEATENNAESVFEVQMFNGPGWLGDDLSCSWRWQEIGMFDGTGGAWWNLAPNKKTYDEFETGDPRKFMTLWCDNGAKFTQIDGTVTDYAYWMSKLATNKDLYGTRKYCPDVQVSDFDNGINDRLIRYADVLLMYAECLNEKSDIAGAKQYINMVRSRANNVVPSEQPSLWYQHSPGTIPDVDGLLAQNITKNGVPLNNIKSIIAHERFVELAGEYLRYFDLLRWGMADAKWLEPLKTIGWTQRAMYYPFPQVELDNNKNLRGNAMNN
ncbi:RagB/SusD family nutrient uptake outer membrane protein [Pedobacter alluvionis]|uniref:Putative outer membrane starch-binding protein n=1 Tax=Pedobacter alluvionis TaxID=475253 RepID=A0A497XUZ4_9SPHI|nr:RagB/SusD family nutrient uptake outer membrane protein [Pedobacter alluvionis]RLJ72497.1 putative outer membrane starch-binding protein [Pedobacter alluvionis]TFB28179.1 RagB/SusD family nutrient uptake outer membrane protein [Pedobacter alluvionis]